MTKDTLKFPKGFLWGASTSAHQVEGGNINSWSEWEKKNAERLAKEARDKWQNWQVEKFPEMLKKENYISGKACDHYNKYEEDFDIAASLGHNAHRFSIEWSRIEPREGEFNEEEIEHYREVIQALKKRNLEPFVTLWHWTDPLWITKLGGWENKETIKYFARFVKKIAKEFGGEIKYWIPLNEPSVPVGFGYITGTFPPGIKSYWKAWRVSNNLTQAHKEAYKVLHHELGNKVAVGNTVLYHYHVPYRRWHPLDVISTKIFRYFRDVRATSWAEKHGDFIGLDYYFLDTVKFSLFGGTYGPFEIKNPRTEVSDLNWDIFPEGIYHILLELGKYKKPIYIVENGIADRDDTQRASFIKRNLHFVKKAYGEGVDVRGYFHWSLLDNFEWDKGLWPRFGLVEVDYKTLERKVRKSAKEYKKIIERQLVEESKL